MFFIDNAIHVLSNEALSQLKVKHLACSLDRATVQIQLCISDTQAFDFGLAECSDS